MTAGATPGSSRLAVVPALDAGAGSGFAFVVGLALLPVPLPDAIVVDEAVLLGELIQLPHVRHSAVEQVEQAAGRATEERAGQRQAVLDGRDETLVGRADVTPAILALVDFIADVDLEEVAELALHQAGQTHPAPAVEVEERPMTGLAEALADIHDLTTGRAGGDFLGFMLAGLLVVDAASDIHAQQASRPNRHRTWPGRRRSLPRLCVPVVRTV